MKALSAAGEQREQLDALIAAWEAELSGAKEQVDAALAADVDAFVATLDDASASTDAFAEATSAIGVPDCGQG